MVFYGIAVAVCALSGVGETTLIDFQADWCGPCRSMQPTVARLESAGFPVRRVNIDREPQLAAQYGVSSIPCFVAVVDGRERGRLVGATSYEQLQQMLNAAGVRPQNVAAAGAPAPNGVSGFNAQASASAQPGRNSQAPGIQSPANQGPANQAMIARGQSPDGLFHRMHLPGFGRRSDAGGAPSSAPPGAAAPGGLAPPDVSIPSVPTGPPAAGQPAPAAVMAQQAPPPADGGRDLASLPSQGLPPQDASGGPMNAATNNAANNSWPGRDAAGPSESGMAANSAGPSAPPPAADNGADNSAPADPSAGGGSTGSEDPALQKRLMAASIRLRVEDSTGNSYGSGTIIDQRTNPDGHGGEALVLTCGHIFRESEGRGTIHIDRFDGTGPQTVEGRMLRYDLKRDIALVTFKTDTPVAVARLAEPGHQSKQGDTVMSIGCDNGQQPSLRRSRVTAINSIVGPPNLQVAGQPAVGRSGGGLFDSQGHVIGVCNFADPQDHAGLFAEVASAQEVLDQLGLGEVYRHAAVADNSAPKGPTAPTPPPMADAMPRPLAAPDSDLAAVPKGAPVETMAASRDGAPVEVICIVRSGNGKETHRETIFIDNASSDLLERLAAEKRTAQAAFPTSLTVAHGAAVPATSAVPVASAAPPTPQAAAPWQPHWR